MAFVSSSVSSFSSRFLILSQVAMLMASQFSWRIASQLMLMCRGNVCCSTYCLCSMTKSDHTTMMIVVMFIFCFIFGCGDAFIYRKTKVKTIFKNVFFLYLHLENISICKRFWYDAEMICSCHSYSLIGCIILCRSIGYVIDSIIICHVGSLIASIGSVYDDCFDICSSLLSQFSSKVVYYSSCSAMSDQTDLLHCFACKDLRL